MKNLQRGFILPAILIVVALLVIGSGVYVYENKKTETPVIDTETQQPNQQINNQTPSVNKQAKPLDKTTNNINIEKIEFNAYLNQRAGFTMIFPAEWKYKVDEKNLTFFNKNSSLAQVKVGIFSRNQDLEEATKDMEEFVKYDKENSSVMGVQKEESKIGGLRVLSYNMNVIIDKDDGSGESYSGKVMRVFIENAPNDEKLIYGIDYSNSKEEFDKDLSTVMKMINSFRKVTIRGKDIYINGNSKLDYGDSVKKMIVE